MSKRCLSERDMERNADPPTMGGAVFGAAGAGAGAGLGMMAAGPLGAGAPPR